MGKNVLRKQWLSKLRFCQTVTRSNRNPEPITLTAEERKTKNFLKKLLVPKQHEINLEAKG